MKKILLNIIIIIIPLYMSSQTIKATYIRFQDNEKAEEILTDPYQKSFLNDLKFLSKPNKFILIYSDNQSIYNEIKRNIEEEENKLEIGETESLFNQISKKQAEPSILYKNFNNGKYISQKYLLGKLFLVEGELKPVNWTLTDKEIDFGDFKCKVATAIDSYNRNIEAYYTEEIPVSDGPDLYFGLPGLILQVKIAANVISLTELKLFSDNTEIKIPNKGKKVTESEYEKISKEKMLNFDGIF